MALAARGSARLQFADVDVSAAQSELTEAVGRLHAAGQRVGGGDRRGRPRTDGMGARRGR